jgi:hypothetical protein
VEQQREVPVANTPDQHRFDDWTGQLMSDLAEPLPNNDDRCRFYESLVRVGVWAIYRDHGYRNVREFIEDLSAAIEAQWKEDRAQRAAPGPTGFPI